MITWLKNLWLRWQLRDFIAVRINVVSGTVWYRIVKPDRGLDTDLAADGCVDIDELPDDARATVTTCVKAARRHHIHPARIRVETSWPDNHGFRCCLDGEHPGEHVTCLPGDTHAGVQVNH